MLGLNFYKKSPRYIPPTEAVILVANLRAELQGRTPVIVGLFVNEVVYTMATVAATVKLDAIQLSGDESVEVIRELRVPSFKAIQPMTAQMALEDVAYFSSVMPTDERLPSLLLDAYHPNLRGGTGETASIETALAIKERVPRMMLAGGLTPENVAERVQAIQPWAVDVASGVESGTPGVKDAAKIRDFIERAKDS
jgi:phosphoribosylanthranilate isomerase